MKSSFRHILGGVAVTALLLTGGNALAQIANTKHNLGSTNNRANENRSDVADLCVFCHTPHGADTSATAPLWNRKLRATPTDYKTYDSLGTSTLDGNVLTVGSVSLACLSCHDGSQALDSVLNSPGSGGYNANGARMGGGASWTAGTGTPVNTTTGILGAGVANLGTDLTDDHPVGIIYGGFSRPTGQNNALVKIDTDFVTPSNAGSVWWVDTDQTGGTREKSDMQLYTRETSTNVNEPYVECASCHDPHIANPTFLRIENTGSAVCLACHTK